MELAPSDVTAILESPRGITVKTNERFKGLFLSNKLVDYETLRGRLLSWAPTVDVSLEVYSIGYDTPAVSSRFWFVCACSEDHFIVCIRPSTAAYSSSRVYPVARNVGHDSVRPQFAANTYDYEVKSLDTLASTYSRHANSSLLELSPD